MPYKNIADKRANDAAYWRKVKGSGDIGKIAPRLNRPIGVVQTLKVKAPKQGLKIAVVTDPQVMPRVPLQHLAWAGEYIAAKQPDVVVCIGDFGDYPSMAHFGKGTTAREGDRLAADVGAVRKGMELLLNPIRRARGYDPKLVFTMGNHDDHPARYEREHPEIEGSLPNITEMYQGYGWDVYPFLQPVAIGGVAFCHYFPSGPMGRPISSAPEILRKLHMSAFAGHQQGREIAYSRRADGSSMTAIISGSFYQHTYEYLSPFTNGHWRGMFMLHEVKDGTFDDMAVSIDFLRRKFA